MVSHKLKFLEHISELRSRLINIIICYVITFIICCYFNDKIYYFVVIPLATALGTKSNFIYTGLTEAFFSSLRISTKFALIVTLPYISFQIYRFIEPGLYKNEKLIIKLLLISAQFLFFIGISFVYYLVMPKAFEFFLTFQKDTVDYSLNLEPRISEYISIVIDLVFAFGIAFQLPIIILILVSLRVIGSETLKLKRRIAILLIFIIAGIITPPDVVSQLLLAFPLLALYEITIIFAKSIESRRHDA